MASSSYGKTQRELARGCGLGKRFGAIAAVRGVSCSFCAGEIHAVCGENGAGKSTLLKIVAGMLVPDEGDVLVGPTPLVPHTPREAIRRGVAMVLQHFALIPVLSALENVILGAEPTRTFGVVDRIKARDRARRIALELGVDLPLDAPVGTLGVGDRQRIEIARALFRDAALVILDEPTAVLTKTEAATLYATLRRLADRGKGIVVVTHKMDEVRAHADVVTVMRRGALVFTRPIDRTSDVNAQVDEVAAAIMGSGAGRAERRPAPTETTAPREAGDEVLVMEDVQVGRGLVSASLTLRSGEIVGIAGVEGNGQKELVAVLAGDVAPSRGTIVVERTAIVREDRQTEGLVLDAPLRENLVLGELERFTRWGLIEQDRLDAEAAARLERSGAVRSVSGMTHDTHDGASVAGIRDALDRPARTLSGGNQQKIVVSRAIARDARLIVAAQPTRGVDLAAATEIHAKLTDAAKKGAGVLVISADLDELRAIASRILVLARGRFVAELAPTASDEEVGRRMLGLEESSGPASRTGGPAS